MAIPAIVIAGTGSGVGKTTITCGIMQALKQKGLKVQPFKVGPDYIDPAFHTYITGYVSRNLDSWMLDESTVRYLFNKNCEGRDFAVIEGVMGMYDGFGGSSSEGSTVHVSEIVDAPVILLINGAGVSRSAAAIVHGYATLEKGAKVAGVIINQVGSEVHYQLIKDSIESITGIRCFGYLPPIEEVRLPERHLGLVPSCENADLQKKLEILAARCSETIDLDGIIKMAGEYLRFRKETKEQSSLLSGITPVKKCRIGLARDKAFNFYYQDSLDLLQELGAELVEFSPLEDSKLPEAIDGLYLGGGFPEVFAVELEQNLSMKESIRSAIEMGLPTYAECGGLMYLTRTISDLEGNSHSMCGVVPADAKMTTRLQRFGYIDLEFSRDNILGSRGTKIRGHEFHHSTVIPDSDVPTSFSIRKTRSGQPTRDWSCGFTMYNMVAGYPHLHFWSNPELAESFVNNCVKKKGLTYDS